MSSPASARDERALTDLLVVLDEPQAVLRTRRTVVARHWPLLAVIAGMITASALLRWTSFPFAHSGDADEGTYVLQARLLMDGHLTLPARDFTGAFRPWLTGEAHGRVFTQYYPGWPALLAASATLTGGMQAAPLLAAVLLVAGVYALALELFRRRQTAAFAAALIGWSPIVLLHSVLYLPYLFTAGLLTGGLALLLRGLRSGSRPALVLAGVASGVALITRPFDVLLFALPALAYVAVVRREEWRRALRLLGWALAGLVPFVALLLAYNGAITGSPFQPPFLATDHMNDFGFGERRIMPGEPLVHYGFSTAWLSLRANLHAVPSWLPGGALTAVLALLRVPIQRGRAQRVLLLSLVLAFPLGYFVWWGTALSAHGSVNGIGPHYYLPIFGLLAILAAEGLTAITGSVWQRWRRWPVMAGLVTLVAAAGYLTATSAASKLATQREVNGYYQQVSALLPPSTSARQLVIVSSAWGSRFVGQPYPFLINDHGIGARRLFAADTGADSYLAQSAHADRQAFRVAPPPPDLLHDPSPFRGATTPLELVTGARICVTAELRSSATQRVLTSFLSIGGRTVSDAAVTAARNGAVRTSWRVRARQLSSGAQYVTVGFTAGAGERWEQRLSTGPTPASPGGSSITVQAPGRTWHLANPSRPTWQELHPDGPLRVSVRGCD